MNRLPLLINKHVVFSNKKPLWLRTKTARTREKNEESRISLTIGVLDPSSTDRNPVPEIRTPRLGIQNPRLSWIILYIGDDSLYNRNEVCLIKIVTND